jgi:hypothetical protein
MVEDYLTYSRPLAASSSTPRRATTSFARRLEGIMTVLLNPDRARHSLSVARARALLAARVTA